MGCCGSKVPEHARHATARGPPDENTGHPGIALAQSTIAWSTHTPKGSGQGHAATLPPPHSGGGPDEVYDNATFMPRDADDENYEIVVKKRGRGDGRGGGGGGGGRRQSTGGLIDSARHTARARALGLGSDPPDGCHPNPAHGRKGLDTYDAVVVMANQPSGGGVHAAAGLLSAAAHGSTPAPAAAPVPRGGLLQPQRGVTRVEATAALLADELPLGAFLIREGSRGVVLSCRMEPRKVVHFSIMPTGRGRVKIKDSRPGGTARLDFASLDSLVVHYRAHPIGTRSTIVLESIVRVDRSGPLPAGAVSSLARAHSYENVASIGNGDSDGDSETHAYENDVAHGGPTATAAAAAAAAAPPGRLDVERNSDRYNEMVGRHGSGGEHDYVNGEVIDDVIGGIHDYQNDAALGTQLSSSSGC